MKRIDDFDRYMPSEKASIAKLKRSLMALAPQNTKEYMKQDYYGPLESRQQFVQKNRRNFLDMIARAGIASPLLRLSPLLAGIMSTRYAQAQATGKKRVVYCYLNSGAQPNTWLPTSATAMNICTQPYGPQGYNVSSICNFRQVDVLQQGHANATQALGIPGYGIPTMDARIAAVLGATTPYSSIYLGSQATTQGVLCSTVGPCTDDPAKAFSNLFKAPPPMQAADETYKTAFDAQLSAINKIKTKLGEDELTRLNTHAAALEKLKQNIADQQAGGGVDVATCGSSVGAISNANIQSRGKTQADIIIAALKCGLTNVATLQLGNHQGDWYGHNTVYKQDAHNSCHSSAAETNDEMVRYLSDVPAYFLSKLMTEKDADGDTLIDNTVFVQVTCMGNGRDHSPGNGPFIVATRMNGFNKTFSRSAGGTTEDLNGAIPRGLGIANLLKNIGTRDLGLLG